MTRWRLNRLRAAGLRSERGAVLVITVVVMLFLLVAAAWAIDAGIWYVHSRHLQTEADAAALAGAQDFQYPCTTASTGGATSTDTLITTDAKKYDGTEAPPYGPYYNAQVSGKTPAVPSTIYSSTQHNLFSEVNQPNYFNQTFPNDTAPSGSVLSGSPCTDGLIDVKMTETNVGSFIPAWINPLSFINPPYINHQAQLKIEQLSQSNNAEPFIEPLPNPSSATVQLVNESTGAVIGPSVSLSPLVTGGTSDPTTLTGTETLPSTVPAALVGMEVTPSNGPTYSTNSHPPYGIAYMHLWTATGNTAPYAGDVWVAPSGTTVCPSSPASSPSNFVSSSSSTAVRLCANVQLPAGETCSTLQANGFTLTMNVNPGSAVAVPKSACSGTTTATTWTLPSISVPSNSGGTVVKLSWVQTTGTIGTNACTTKTTNPCTGSFGAVQEIFSGAYDSQSSQTSGSGSTLSASITDTTGNVISSETQTSAAGQTVTFTVHSLSFSNASSISSPPVVLSFGGPQANASLSCAGSSAGSPQLQQSIATGCNSVYQTTTGTCPNADNPPSCATENPGTGKLSKDLGPGMNARVYCGGVVTACNPQCATVSAGDYNFWTAPNSVSAVIGQHPPSPRLITLLVTDNSALSTGGAQGQVPIRQFVEFYVTGWAGDPCSGSNVSGTYTDMAGSTLTYTGDDSTSTAGVLLGHFVAYVKLSGGTGSGAACDPNQLGSLCAPIFTK